MVKGHQFGNQYQNLFTPLALALCYTPLSTALLSQEHHMISHNVKYKADTTRSFPPDTIPEEAEPKKLPHSVVREP